MILLLDELGEASRVYLLRPDEVTTMTVALVAGTRCFAGSRMVQLEPWAQVSSHSPLTP